MKSFIKNTLSLSLLAVLAGAAVSCDFLKEKSYDFVQPDAIPDSDKGAELFMIGCYNEVIAMFNSNTFPMTWLYDEDYLTGPSWAFGYLGAGNYLNDGYIPNYWTGLYTMIHRCNYSLYKIGQMVNLSDEERAYYTGEIKFLKAWSYFMLVRAFGPVPLRKQSISETAERNVPRSSVAEVYAYILELLDEAKEALPVRGDARYVEGMPTAGTAAGFKAKVCATMASGAMPSGTKLWVYGGTPYVSNAGTKAYTDPQKLYYDKEQLAGYDAFDPKEYYRMAYEEAEAIMNGTYGDYHLDDFSNIWLRSNACGPEILWSVRPNASDVRYCEYFSTHICGVTQSASDGRIYNGMWYGGRDHWYKLAESQDLRVKEGIRHRWKRVWDDTIAQYYPNNQEYNALVENKIPPYDDGEYYVCPQFDVYYLAYPTKYIDRQNNPADEHGEMFWPMLRTADIYLIYAEAYAEVNGTADGKALAALNAVRDRSNASQYGLSGVGSVADMVDFRSTVLRERALELFCEGDRRWDLVRWGVFVPVMNAIGEDEIGVNKLRYDRHKLFPIPPSEMDSNPAITENNPGWD